MNPKLTFLFLLALVALAWLGLHRVMQYLHRPQPAHRPPPRHGMKRHWRKVYLLPLGLERLRGWLPGRRLKPMVTFANIGEGTHSDGKKSYIPDAATTARYLLYKKGTDVDHCAVCGASDDPLGPSDDQAGADSVPISIHILGAVRGTVRVVTDGTIADGDYVKCGASGKATKASSTDLSFGRAIIPTDCSSADTDVIVIRPALPAKYVF